MRRNDSIYDVYLKTNVSGYYGILNCALDELHRNNFEASAYYLNKLSRNLECFLRETGLYRGIKSLPMLHNKLKACVQHLNTNMVSIQSKRIIEDKIYSFISAFAALKDFCSRMLYLGV